MLIRLFVDADLPVLIDLTIETFRPLFEDAIRPAYGQDLFDLHHGQWEQEYRDELPGLHDPETRRWIAVAEVEGAIAGFVAWNSARQPDHGSIHLLAVAPAYRRRHVGQRLCRHAIDGMEAVGVRVVEVATGGRTAVGRG